MRIFEGFQRGINLGGWISQFAEYKKEHFENFIIEQDIENIAKMGFDHVRVPVDYNVLEDETGKPLESGYKYLTDCAAWCRKRGLHILIDLHEVYGYSFDPLKKDMDRKAFFYNDALQERFFDLWRRLAKRFGQESDYVAFELLNEVVSPEVHEAWNLVAKKAVKAIREFAPNTYIVIGGVCYNNITSVPLLDKPYDDKIVYNFHCYEPMAFTHQKAYWVAGMEPDSYMAYPDTLECYREKSRAYPSEMVRAIYAEQITEIGEGFFDSLFRIAVEAAEKNHAPLYCGEYGVIELAPMEDTLRWFKDIHSVFEKYHIGRAMWNYKSKDFGLMDSNYAKIRDELIQYI